MFTSYRMYLVLLAYGLLLSGTRIMDVPKGMSLVAQGVCFVLSAMAFGLWLSCDQPFLRFLAPFVFTNANARAPQGLSKGANSATKPQLNPHFSDFSRLVFSLADGARKSRAQGKMCNNLRLAHSCTLFDISAGRLAKTRLGATKIKLMLRPRIRVHFYMLSGYRMVIQGGDV